MKITIPNSQGVETEVDIFPLEYFGQHVLTTKQLKTIFHCTRQNISVNFNRHINNFIEDVDYFFLHGINLKIFLKNYTGNYCKHLGNGKNKYSYRSALALQTHALYLWTVSGARKHSVYLGTEMANRVFDIALRDYFNLPSPVLDPEPQLPPPAQSESPASAQPELNDKQIELMMKLIDMVESGDENTLRNRLIKATASLILGRQI
mgnify:CR=1 FL=1